jgi:ferric-dicitrate binding protein FerR (iron transport regulator)
MAEDELYRLLRKRFTGNISTEEETKLDQWIHDSKENQKTIDALSKVWQEKSAEPELINTEAQIDHIWQRSQISVYSKSIDWNYIIKIAAVVVLFVTTPLFVINWMQYTSTETTATVAIQKLIKSNPAGQKAKFYLPDGSLVWLNGASTVTYHTTFNETNRDISLTGEAFFEVAKNEVLPFQVVSGNITTTAVGTAFNVEAYPEDDQINVSLLHGKVKVAYDQNIEDGILLDPGYQVNFNLVNEKIEKNAFDQNKVTGWKDGKLVFANAGYEEVLSKIEKWYGVTITTQGNPPPGWRLSTTYQDESLRNILRNLRFGKEFNYKLGKDEVIINFQ